MGKFTANENDIAHIEGLYAGRQAVHGDTHCHTKSSQWSDGWFTLDTFKKHMAENQIDFCTVVDHGQVIHMRHEEWDETLFIGGSEPGWEIMDAQVHSKILMDYGMIFTKPEGLEAVLDDFPADYRYNGEMREAMRFRKGFKVDHPKAAEIIASVKKHGGMWIQEHPFARDQWFGYDPVDDMDYWFANEVGFEVLNGGQGDYTEPQNANAYDCWVKLINAGKRLWATAGSDAHSCLPFTWSLSTLYAMEKNNEGYFAQMKVGNLTAGPVGIRMVVGDAQTGSATDFTGKRVVIAVGDFHPLAVDHSHTYRLDVYDETGRLFGKEISSSEMNYFAFDADENAKYYRANVYDVTADKLLAVGNPVFNG